MKIEVRKPTAEELKRLGVEDWPIWTKEVSTFDWYYDDRETCYILEGEVTVRYEGGSVSFQAGDLVIFPKGLKCTWEIRKAVRKHYSFG